MDEVGENYAVVIRNSSHSGLSVLELMVRMSGQGQWVSRAEVEIAPGHEEVKHFVDANVLYGQGLSLVDAHLLASVILAPGTRIWTRDKRLFAAAQRLGIAHTVI